MKSSAKSEIRLATKADLPQLVHVWQSVFGDDEDYILFFLQNRCEWDSVPVCEADGKIVSQLFLLSALLRSGEAVYPVYYLFAAATLPRFRGQGLMGELIRFSQKLCTERQGIVLLPGEESLYDYYSRFGFAPVFRRKLWHGTRDALNALAELAQHTPSQASPFLKSYWTEHNGLFWSVENTAYALCEQSQYRGPYTAVPQTAFVTTGDTCTILSAPDGFSKGVGALLSLTEEAVLDLVLPPDAPIGVLQKGGMLWSPNDSIQIGEAFLSFPME